MKIVKYIFLSCVLASLFSQCSSNEEQENRISSPAVTATAKIPAPFHFQKSIEVKPGLFFDVLSWGRGSDSTGAYLILRSDSTHQKFSSGTGELKGNIIDAWDMDMDSDGNPEIYIQARDKRSKLNLYVYEYDGSGSAQKLRFPDLSSATLAKYRGRDSLYIRSGELIREFPLYKKEDPDNKPSAGKKVIAYTLNRNDFSVQELNPETKEPLKVEKPKAPAKKAPVKKKPARRRR